MAFHYTIMSAPRLSACFRLCFRDVLLTGDGFFKITKELLSNDPADQPCPWSKGSIKAVCLALIFCSSLPCTPVLSEDVVQPRPVSPSPPPHCRRGPSELWLHTLSPHIFSSGMHRQPHQQNNTNVIHVQYHWGIMAANQRHLLLQHTTVVSSCHESLIIPRDGSPSFGKV